MKTVAPHTLRNSKFGLNCKLMKLTIFDHFRVLYARFVPTRLRILYINVVALAWNTILSMAANDNPAAPKIKGADVGKI